MLALAMIPHEARDEQVDHVIGGHATQVGDRTGRINGLRLGAEDRKRRHRITGYTRGLGANMSSTAGEGIGSSDQPPRAAR